MSYETYSSLLSRHFLYVTEIVTGSYQGDLVFRVEDEDGRVGYLVWGYGSCSGCDELEAAYGDEAAESAIAEDMANAVFFGTEQEIRDHALTKDGNRWYAYNEEVRQAIDALFP